MGSEEQEAGVAVTKSLSRRLLRRLPLILILSSVLTSCAVELSNSTVGAGQGCKPSTTDLTHFHTNIFPGVFATCGNNGATNCHAGAAAGTYSFKGFLPSDTDQSKQIANFCAHFLMGRNLIQHPTEFSHGGGIFTTADTNYNKVVQWVNNAYKP